MRAGGDDGIFKGDLPRPLLPDNPNGLRIPKLSPTGHAGNFAGFAQGVQAACQLLNDLVLFTPQGVQVDLGSGEFQTDCPRFVSRFENRRGVKQGFGGDAADMQANPAQPGAFIDQADGKAQVGGPKSGRVTTGTTTQDNEVIFLFFRHGFTP